jgi:hypothetical protein
VVPTDLLAPVPLRAGQSLRLYFRGSAGPSQWKVFNVPGELVASLGFDDANNCAWDPKNLASGVYFVNVKIQAPDGERSFWQRIAVVR